MEDFAYQVVFYAIILGLGALSALFSEKVGIVNIGIEGMISFGGLGYAVASGLIYKINPQLSSGMFQIPLFIFAVLFGMILASLHGFATIKLKADHTISGVAINIVALALAIIITYPTIMGNPQRTINSSINELSYQQTGYGNILSLKLFLFIAVVLSAFILLRKSKWGLRLKAVGENPQAVDVAGVNVISFKWQGILISGALAGLAGGVFCQGFRGSFNGNVFGLGFLALAIMILSHWKVLFIVLSSFIFAMFYYVGFLAEGSALSSLTLAWFNQDLGKYGFLIKTIPYVMTLISLVIFSKNSPGPAAVGLHYDKAKR